MYGFGGDFLSRCVAVQKSLKDTAVNHACGQRIQEDPDTIKHDKFLDYLAMLLAVSSASSAH